MLARLLEECPEQSKPDFPKGFGGGIAHRLDNATSGIVLAARDVESLAVARGRFQERGLQKRYQFLTAGDVPWKEHRIVLPIAHHKRRRRKMIVQRGRHTPHRGKWYPAETRLRMLRRHHWEAVITTGVMHQIRVHAAHVGLPLLGDRLYGGAAIPDEAAPADDLFTLHHETMEGLIANAPELPPPAWWTPLVSYCQRAT